jgi:hypothetical protein
MKTVQYSTARGFAFAENGVALRRVSIGSILCSSNYAARMAKLSPISLDAWTRNQEFTTDQCSENRKSRERNFYFTLNDILRLTEFARNRNMTTKVERIKHRQMPQST